MNENIKKLVDIWETLHFIGGELRDIQAQYPEDNHLREVVDSSINKLSDVAHMALSQAHELRKKEVQDD